MSCGVIQATLLHVLAGRDSTGVISGELLVNGEPLPADFTVRKYVSITVLFYTTMLMAMQWVLSTDGHSSANHDCPRGALVLREASSAPVRTIG